MWACPTPLALGILAFERPPPIINCRKVRWSLHFICSYAHSLQCYKRISLHESIHLTESVGKKSEGGHNTCPNNQQRNKK